VTCETFDLYGEIGDWQLLTLSIGTGGEFLETDEWSLRFEAHNKQQYREGTDGLVILDDMSLSPGACQPNGNCNFEDGLGCSYTQDPFSDFAWMIIQADSLSNIEGPSNDHTNTAFDGYMALVDGSYEQPEGSKAMMKSAQFAANGTAYCFNFYFYVSGKDIGTLQILKGSEQNASDSEVLWSLSGDDGVNSGWQKGQTQYQSKDEDFYFSFKAVMGSGSEGGIAVDDILITQESCQQVSGSARFGRISSYLFVAVLLSKL